MIKSSPERLLYLHVPSPIQLSLLSKTPPKFREAREFNSTQLPHAAPQPFVMVAFQLPSPVGPSSHRDATRQFQVLIFFSFLMWGMDIHTGGWGGQYAAWSIDGPSTDWLRRGGVGFYSYG
jgi:hypothetical protein